MNPGKGFSLLPDIKDLFKKNLSQFLPEKAMAPYSSTFA